ncbi:c-type cytochrome [Camelimonas abortus]|uniref:C-type cytochrome n=1 Tax=Camelimonas abortus TaxID=1017184 RepID=A0ABV7LFP9_9HYPH
MTIRPPALPRFVRRRRPWAGVLAACAAAALATAAHAGDPEAGARVFMKCRACHQIGEGAKHTAGPQLNALIGRKAGTVDGYRFSDAMKNSGLTWDEATLRDYLKAPRAKVPGTRMIFLGVTRESEMDNLLAYLRQFDADGKIRPAQ